MSHGDFDSRAKTWDEPHRVARAETIAARIVETVPLPDNARALDFGCGTGLGTWPIAEHFAHVTLADASVGMLDVARARIQARPDAERFVVRQLDLTEQQLEPGSFDLIYTVMVMHHVSPLEPALSQLAASLRPGGFLAIADLDLDPTGDYHAHEAFSGHHGFRREDLAVKLQEAGFADVSFETVYTMQKDVDGEPMDFPVFLATCHVPSVPVSRDDRS